MNKLQDSMTGDLYPYGRMGIREASRPTMTLAKNILESGFVSEEVADLVHRLLDGLNMKTTMQDTGTGRQELIDSATKLNSIITKALKDLEGLGPIFSEDDKNYLYDGNSDFLRELRAKGAETLTRLIVLQGVIKTHAEGSLLPAYTVEDTDADLILENPELILDTMNEYLKLVDALSQFKHSTERAFDIVEEGNVLIDKKATKLIEQLTKPAIEA
jgi:hypothetical protein